LLLCLIVLAGACGVIYALGQLSADLHRTNVALDALVGRMASVQEDLHSISEDVYSIADDVNAIAESLADDNGDDEETEAVGWRRAAERSGHAQAGGSSTRTRPGATRVRPVHATDAHRLVGRVHRRHAMAVPSAE
jgi:hypothetical protein